MMGDISDVERKDKTGHLRNIIVSANSSMPYTFTPPQQQTQPQKLGPNLQNKVSVSYFYWKYMYSEI
jgi:hypothetical protein